MPVCVFGSTSSCVICVNVLERAHVHIQVVLCVGEADAVLYPVDAAFSLYNEHDD